MASCHTITRHFGQTDLTIALAGNPNVGKSSLFNRLTGSAVETANYPGKTVALNYGLTVHEGKRIGVMDLPGTYALGAVSEDQWVARQAVLENRPDAVVAITDATNLERNLYLVLQFLDLELPLVVAVNLIDEAKRSGIEIDTAALEKHLHAPVVATVATRGQGIPQVLNNVSHLSCHAQASPPLYDSEIEAAVQVLVKTIRACLPENPLGLGHRALALLLLEEDTSIIQAVAEMQGGPAVVARARELASEAEARVGEPLALHIPRARHELARAVAREALIQHKKDEPLSIKLWRLSIQPLTGLPVLAAVLVGLFVFLFQVGGTLAEIFGTFWATFVSPPIQAVITFLLGEGILANIATWGFDAGIEAALGVGIPYVLTFYALLAVLEDSGYMNSIAFLLDAIMKRLGLHGRASIMLLAGAGCNVPAILGTRVLTTRRERIIASTLVVLTPCSARTAVIIGSAALFAGWQYGAALFVISLALLVAVGIGLNKVMPGRSDDLVMEMFPFRIPTLNAIVVKTWRRFKEFVFTALPIVLVGSFVMGALYETDTIWLFSGPLSPIVEGWLGLPAVAGLTLMFAVLRKELALQFLVTLAIVQYGTGSDNLLSFMTPQQLFVYALVNTIYVPCIATIAVLRSELGNRPALAISGFTILLAIVIGGIARYALAAI